MTITVEQLVQREVLCCMSSLVSTLANGYGAVENAARLHSRGRHETAALAELTEQAMELASPVPDYEEAALQAGWEKGDDGEWSAKDQSEETGYGESYVDAASVCLDHDIEPYDREVYEHWGVTQWLADRLIAEGEKVDLDFSDHCVWARTTTGQAIAADDVVIRIHAALTGGEG